MRGYNLAEKVARYAVTAHGLVRGGVVLLISLQKKAASPRQTSAGRCGFLVAAKGKKLGGGKLPRYHQASFGHRDFYTGIHREACLRQPFTAHT